VRVQEITVSDCDHSDVLQVHLGLPPSKQSGRAGTVWLVCLPPEAGPSQAALGSAGRRERLEAALSEGRLPPSPGLRLFARLGAGPDAPEVSAYWFTPGRPRSGRGG
jgi:hypothetical protein